jgi:hypothetical protein
MATPTTQQLWERTKLILDKSEVEWRAKILPLNKLPHEYISAVNFMFDYLHTSLREGPRTEEKLRVLQQNQDKLMETLVMASILSGISVINVHNADILNRQL